MPAPFERTEPSIDAAEKEMLCGWLDFHRATILRKVDGLAEHDAWRPMVASGTSLLGLVKHLAFAEHYWFGEVFGGAAAVLPRPNSAEDFVSRTGETSGDVVDVYLDTCERSRVVVGTAELGDTGRGNVVNRRVPGAPFRPTLRWIMVHMLEETARHNGHADILREQIDGVTGL
ncbi:MAG TPA: DinB family protein [Acidimicrobiales bacterium]|nr:DinB family protein [Acidimicrobiales bacterium]